ncbi:hypothetical protein NVP1111B_46 [Vibrio phage 1.111.B._10N.286.45.E6]|nr:hypothetical protein NVP1111A_46 [Vibrio phage 1.111.A._10N.286.45.E6]AUR88302.1 hypothetical protein NVP1111B_46 [Vibrio phage 1.111.B._10N.286.45.E6]
MKTFETEKRNIPEGATHYSDEQDGSYFCWFAINGEVAKICVLDGVGFVNEWHRCTNEHRGADVKPIPQTKEVEWINGLPPVGVECEMIFQGKGKLITPLYFTDFVDGLVLFYHSSNSKPHCDDTYDWALVENCTFRKPETPEQKLERERIEAAKYLYSKHCVAVKHPFKDLDNNSELLNAWLVIVDETNYKVKGE